MWWAAGLLLVVPLGIAVLNVQDAQRREGQVRGPRAVLVARWTLSLAFSAVLWWVSMWVYAGSAKEQESRLAGVCRSNLCALARAALLYTDDNDGAFPVSAGWADALTPYLDKEAESQWLCPQAGWKRTGYAWNAACSGIDSRQLTEPGELVLLFESNAGWNAAGGPELLPAEPRHYGGDIYAFADGRAIWVVRKKVGQDARGRPIWAKEPDGDWVKWEP